MKSELALSTIVLLALLAGCAPTGKETDQEAPQGADASANSTKRISLTAEELAAAFKENEAAANERFLHQEVELTGTVQSVGAFSYPGGYIYLAGFKWETENKRPWEVVLPGQTVTVLGTFEPGVVMKITNVSGERRVLKAEELAQELEANAAATHEKYLDKWLEIQGEVVKVETPDAEPICIVLKGQDDVLVQCRCHYEQNKFGEQLKAGDKVRLVGLYAQPEKAGEPLIVSCYGIEQ